MNVTEMSSRELKNLHARITDELTRRQGALQKTCEHPEWSEIMYMRPGATYTGCVVCGMAMNTLELGQRQEQEQEQQKED